MKINTVYTSNKPNQGIYFKGSKNTPLERNTKKIELKVNPKEANGILKSAKRFVGYSLTALSVLFGGHCATSVAQEPLPTLAVHESHQAPSSAIFNGGYIKKTNAEPIYDQVDNEVKKAFAFADKMARHAVEDLGKIFSFIGDNEAKNGESTKNINPSTIDPFEGVTREFEDKLEKMKLEKEVEKDPQPYAREAIEEKLSKSIYDKQYKNYNGATLDEALLNAVKSGNDELKDYLVLKRVLRIDQTIREIAQYSGGVDAYAIVANISRAINSKLSPLFVASAIHKEIGTVVKENVHNPGQIEPVADVETKKHYGTPRYSDPPSRSIETATKLSKLYYELCGEDIQKTAYAYNAGIGHAPSYQNDALNTPAEKYAKLVGLMIDSKEPAVEPLLSPYKYNKEAFVDSLHAAKKAIRHEFKSEFFPTSEKLFSSEKFNYSFEKSVDATIKALRKMR